MFGTSGVLLSTSVSLTNVSITFPVKIKLTLMLNMFIGCFDMPGKSPIALFKNIFLVILTVIFGKVTSDGISRMSNRAIQGEKILVTIYTNVLVTFFCHFITTTVSLRGLRSPTINVVAPCSTLFIFTVNVFVDGFLFGSLLVEGPFAKIPITCDRCFGKGVGARLINVLKNTV